MSTLVNTWKNYIEKVHQVYGIPARVEADMVYLDEINACTEIKQAAAYAAGVESIYWAPDQKLRKFTPEYFAHSLIIGDDGCGNYFCWMDARDANSQILYICHDPAIIMVIANTATEWLNGLIKGFQSPTFKDKEESEWGNFFETSGLEKAEQKIWQDKLNNGAHDELGLKVGKKEGLNYFNFTEALPGAGVSLAYNGKYTNLIPCKDKGTISLGVLGKDEIKARRKADLVIYTLMAACFIASLYYFNQFKGKTLLASILPAIASTIVVFIALASLYMWLDSRKDKTK